MIFVFDLDVLGVADILDVGTVTTQVLVAITHKAFEIEKLAHPGLDPTLICNLAHDFYVDLLGPHQ